MIRSGLILMIRQKAQSGQSPYAIGKEMGISKNTAKKYVAENPKCHDLKGRTHPSKLDPYKSSIDNMIANEIFNCVVIRERFQAMGYDGGITITKDYVQLLRPPLFRFFEKKRWL